MFLTELSHHASLISDPVLGMDVSGILRCSLVLCLDFAFCLFLVSGEKNSKRPFLEALCIDFHSQWKFLRTQDCDCGLFFACTTYLQGKGKHKHDEFIAVFIYGTVQPTGQSFHRDRIVLSFCLWQSILSCEPPFCNAGKQGRDINISQLLKITMVVISRQHLCFMNLST